MTMNDATAGACDSTGVHSISESQIIREMVDLVDAMPSDGLDANSCAPEIVSTVALLSRVWGPLTSATEYSETSWLADSQSVKFAETAGSNRFEIRRLLGHGGFGVVLLA